MNKVILIGNLAADPEFRTTQSEISNVSFRIAVQRRYTNQQGIREADFISCVAWRQTAEFIHRYFIKGNKMAIEGCLQTRSYDAQDGSKRYVTEVLVDNVEFVTPKTGTPSPSHGQQGYGQAAPQQRPEQMRMDTSGFTEVDDDELPF